jgi:hypothetical protein
VYRTMSDGLIEYINGWVYRTMSDGLIEYIY